jgi:hypothetical protein
MNQNLDVFALETMLLEDLAQLPAAVLLDLQNAVAHETEIARTHAKVLAAAFAQRYALREKEARLANAKPTGRIRFDDEGFVVTAEAPKQVHWDRDLLAAALDKFPIHISEQYAKWTLMVEERRYAEAPPTLKAAMEEARTVSVGKSNYQLSYKEEGAA